MIDFWGSEDAFMAFVERARPIFETTGMPPVMPKIEPAVNVMTR